MSFIYEDCTLTSTLGFLKPQFNHDKEHSINLYLYHSLLLTRNANSMPSLPQFNDEDHDLPAYLPQLTAEDQDLSSYLPKFTEEAHNIPSYLPQFTDEEHNLPPSLLQLLTEDTSP